MESSDVHSIQFLDLSEVDETEKTRLLSSLEFYDPSVQLPWIKNYNESVYSGIKQKQSDVIRNQYTVVHATSVNIRQDQAFHHSQPDLQTTVTNYHHNYNLPSVYQSQYAVPPQNSLNHAPTYPANCSDNHAPYNQVNPYVPNCDNSGGLGALMPPVMMTQSLSPVKPVAEVKPFNQNTISSASQQIVVHQVTAVEPVSLTVVANRSNSPLQNGFASKSESAEVASSAPANKSWASLFNSKPISNMSDGCTTNGSLKPTNHQNVVVETNNNSASLCPIKFPRKAAFVDPDCYRMGEFLDNYIVDGRVVSLQPRGLLNQSNYCYIHSILQALLACPPVYNLLSGLAKNITSNQKRKPTPVIDGMCRFVKEFQQLSAGQRVNRRQDKNQKKEQGVSINYDAPFEPFWMYKMLNGFRTDLIEGRQEDAEEFLGCLLNGLNDEMLELVKLIKSNDANVETSKDLEQDSDKEWQVMGPKNKGSVTRRTDFGRTPISDIFGGFLKSRIHRAGDYWTENIQPFFTLQLNIEKVKTVREALEALVSKNQLEGVTSSKTNEEVEAWQQVMLEELPVVLILHLKCFDFKLDGCKKIIKALEFPIDLKIDANMLSLKTSSAKEKQYKLFAVVYHDGKEATKGHYVTDAFHVGYSSWLRYDDASVKPVQEENVLKPLGTRVPYLLFYRRSDTIRSK